LSESVTTPAVLLTVVAPKVLPFEVMLWLAVPSKLGAKDVIVIPVDKVKFP
jgi:hypothetical protein